MITIEIRDSAVQQALRNIGQRVADMSPVMRAIGVEMLSETEGNFQYQGRPKWMGLASRTIEQRTRKGSWPGMILQREGDLAGAVRVESDSNSMTLGVLDEIKYAAIHQFGGMAGRGRKVKIPARPYMPFDINGNLTDTMHNEVLSIASDYLRKVIG
ncbi:MAG: phage virion morphogenesis protein [Sulfuriferula sp.]|nr:phage virion morphogenesis protein [Sulfuriferula sp.]